MSILHSVELPPPHRQTAERYALHSLNSDLMGRPGDDIKSIKLDQLSKLPSRRRFPPKPLHPECVDGNDRESLFRLLTPRIVVGCWRSHPIIFVQFPGVADRRRLLHCTTSHTDNNWLRLKGRTVPSQVAGIGRLRRHDCSEPAPDWLLCAAGWRCSPGGYRIITKNARTRCWLVVVVVVVCLLIQKAFTFVDSLLPSSSSTLNCFVCAPCRSPVLTMQWPTWNG